MLVVYDSLTGMGKRFAAKLSENTKDIRKAGKLEEDCILVTRSYGFGQMTGETRAFLEANADRVKGVAVSGNKNWGSLYGGAAKEIEKEFGLTIIHIFEVSGFPSDVKKVKKYMEDL